MARVKPQPIQAAAEPEAVARPDTLLGSFMRAAILACHFNIWRHLASTSYSVIPKLHWVGYHITVIKSTQVNRKGAIVCTVPSLVRDFGLPWMGCNFTRVKSTQFHRDGTIACAIPTLPACLFIACAELAVRCSLRESIKSSWPRPQTSQKPTSSKLLQAQSAKHNSCIVSQPLPLWSKLIDRLITHQTIRLIRKNQMTFPNDRRSNTSMVRHSHTKTQANRQTNTFIPKRDSQLLH